MNELTKHIEILLLNNDCVIVPGFGGFVAHYCAATYAEDDSRFSPPKRTLGFNPQLTLNDSLLAQSYVEAYDISYPEAVLRIEAEVEDIIQSIDMYGLYDFQGIGIVSKTNDGRYEFEPCMAGLQTPSLYALSSYCVGEIKEEEEPQSVQNMATAVMENEVENTEDYDDEDEYDEESGLHISYRKLWYAAAAAVIFLLLPMAYNSLSVGRGSQTGNVIKSSVGDTGVEVASKLGKGLDTFVNSTASAKTTNDETQPKETTKESKKENAPKEETGKKQPAKTYSIVLASRVSKKGAESFVANLARKGLNEASIYKKGAMRQVLYGNYATEAEAKSNLSKLQHKDSSFEGTWVQKID